MLVLKVSVCVCVYLWVGVNALTSALAKMCLLSSHPVRTFWHLCRNRKKEKRNTNLLHNFVIITQLRGGRGGMCWRIRGVALESEREQLFQSVSLQPTDITLLVRPCDTWLTEAFYGLMTRRCLARTQASFQPDFSQKDTHAPNWDKWSQVNEINIEKVLTWLLREGAYPHPPAPLNQFIHALVILTSIRKVNPLPSQSSLICLSRVKKRGRKKTA